jgi:hypothetical protein
MQKTRDAFLLLAASAVLVSGCSTSGSGPPRPQDAAMDSPQPCAGAHMVDDPLDGVCKPDGLTTNIGAPCTMTGHMDPLCSGDGGVAAASICLDYPNDNFPGGYCTFEPCSVDSPCPVNSTCGGLGGEQPACYKKCDTDSDCRTPDYKCWEIGGKRMAGPFTKVCYLKDWPCAQPPSLPSGSPNAVCPDSAPKCFVATDAGGAGDAAMTADAGADDGGAGGAAGDGAVANAEGICGP